MVKFGEEIYIPKGLNTTINGGHILIAEYISKEFFVHKVTNND